MHGSVSARKGFACEIPTDHPWPVLELDEKGRILRGNPAAGIFFGMDEASLPGLKVNLPLRAGVSSPGRVGVGPASGTEGEVEQAALGRAAPGSGAAWLLTLVPPISRGGETSFRRFKVTLSMQVAMRLLDPIRLASHFAEKVATPADPEQLDYIERLRRNLLDARTRVAALREYLDIANREYRFEILDFKKISESVIRAIRRKWTGLKLIQSEMPPLLFLGNEYLFQLLLERLVGFALAGEKPATMLLLQAIPPKAKQPGHTTLVIQCRGRAPASLPAAMTFRTLGSLDPWSAVSDPNLYLARQIMDLHEGKLRCEASARGSGVSLFMKFPILPLQ